MSAVLHSLRIPHPLLIVLAVSVAAAALLFVPADSSDSAGEYVEFEQDDYRLGLSIYSPTSSIPYVLTIYSYEGNDTEIVVPDYFTYNGEKFYVDYFNPDIYSGEGGLRAPCKSITSFTFPSKMLSIDGDWSIFTSLKTVNIGPAVEDIDMEGFLGSIETVEEVNVYGSGTYFSSVDGVLYNASKSELLFYPYEKEDTSYTIPAATTIIDNSSHMYDNDYLQALEVESGNPALTAMDGVLYNTEKTSILLYPNGRPADTFVMPDTVTYMSRPLMSNYLKNVTFSSAFEEATVEIGFADGYLVIPMGSVSSLFGTGLPFAVSFYQTDSLTDEMKDVSPNPYYRLDVGALKEFSAPLTLKVYPIRYLATNMHVLNVEADGSYTEVGNIDRARSGATFQVYSSGDYTYIFKDTTTIENAPLIAAIIAGAGTVVALVTIVRNSRRNG